MTFTNVHRDIERHIKESDGVEKRKDGFLIYHGYDAALEHVVDEYLQAKAYEPLIKFFRGWNWEVGDHDFLRLLTDRLLADGEWNHLERLWNGVINKRRKLYREMMRIREEDPKAIPQRQCDDAKALLVWSLERLRDLARELGRDEDVEGLERRIKRLGNRE